MPAIKHDEGKRRYDLLPLDALEEIVKVLEFGARRYGEENWRGNIELRRYYAAALRHIFAWKRGEQRDPETGLHHLAHAAVNCLFMVSHEFFPKPMTVGEAHTPTEQIESLGLKDIQVNEKNLPIVEEITPLIF